MKRLLMLLAAGVATAVIGCTADTTPAPVADTSTTTETASTPDATLDVKMISLNVPNMT
jgi:hypothetical protein